MKKYTILKLTKFIQNGAIIKAALYNATLQSLRKVIKICQLGKLTKQIILLHDNVTPHFAWVTQNLKIKYKWDVWKYLLAYMTSLCDFHAFSRIENNNHRMLVK